MASTGKWANVTIRCVVHDTVSTISMAKNDKLCSWPICQLALQVMPFFENCRKAGELAADLIGHCLVRLLERVALLGGA